MHQSTVRITAYSANAVSQHTDTAKPLLQLLLRISVPYDIGSNRHV